MHSIRMALQFGQARQEALKQELSSAYERLGQLKTTRVDNYASRAQNEALVHYLQNLYAANEAEEELFKQTGKPKNDPKKCDDLVAVAKKEQAMQQLLRTLLTHLVERVQAAQKTMNAMQEVKEYLETMMPALQQQQQQSAKKLPGADAANNAALSSVRSILEALTFAERKYRIHSRTASELLYTVKRLVRDSRGISVVNPEDLPDLSDEEDSK